MRSAVEEKIIVIGGTGMLGWPVARKLKEDGFQVTIMSTDPDRARALVGEDLTLVKGDVTDIESLKPAIEGQDYVYLNLNSRLELELYQRIEIDGTANVAGVAAETGVRRIGCISGASSTGEERGIIYLDAKVKAERALIDSGVPYSIMRPSWFVVLRKPSGVYSKGSGNRSGQTTNSPRLAGGFGLCPTSINGFQKRRCRQ